MRRIQKSIKFGTRKVTGTTKFEKTSSSVYPYANNGGTKNFSFGQFFSKCSKNNYLFMFLRTFENFLVGQKNFDTLQRGGSKILEASVRNTVKNFGRVI